MRKDYFFYFITLAMFFLLISGCSGGSSGGGNNPVESDNTVVDSGSDDFGLDNREILKLVNELREYGCQDKNGKYYPPVDLLEWNNKLGNAAKNHSLDLKENGWSDHPHTGSDGSSPGDRILSAGYDWKTCGENVAWGYSDEEAVVEGWRLSPGHCANMMNPAFKQMGAGKSGSYWAQTFGTLK